MNVARADYAVIGHSLAGISAALTLAKSGGRVILLGFHRDTDTLAELPRIQQTSLGASASGVAFERAMQEMLEQATVERRTDCFIEKVYSDEDVTAECDDRRWPAEGRVCAEWEGAGIDLEGSATLQGFGLSYSAAADASFFLSRRVVVYGDAPRVFQHARIAAQYASAVVVLMKMG